MTADCTLHDISQETVGTNNIPHAEINMSNAAPEHICSLSFRMEINGLDLDRQLARTWRIAETNSCTETVTWFSGLIMLPNVAL